MVPVNVPKDYSYTDGLLEDILEEKEFYIGRMDAPVERAASDLTNIQPNIAKVPKP